MARKLISSSDLTATVTKIRALRLKQSDISGAVDASQSQISRVLSGQCPHAVKLFKKICIYVESKEVGPGPDSVRENDELISALSAAWDGSRQHAKALAAVIRGLGALTIRN